MLNKKYLLFDLDGTLTDPFEGITKSLQYSLKHIGIDESQNNLKRFIGPPLKESFSEFYGLDDDTIKIAINKYRERFMEKGIYENEIIAGIPELLKELKENGKSLVLATSKPIDAAKIVLDYFDLKKHFDFLGGSTFNGDRITKSDVIAHIIKDMPIDDISQAVMIGDRKYDILGAKEFNIESIGLLFGYGDRNEHQKAGANYIVEKVSDLKKLLLG